MRLKEIQQEAVFLDFDLREGAGGEGGFEGVDGVFVEDLGADEVDEAAGVVGVVSRDAIQIECSKLGLLEVDAAIFFVVADAAGEGAVARGRLSGEIVEEGEAGLLAELVRKTGGDIEAEENFVFIRKGLDAGAGETQLSDAGVISVEGEVGDETR